MATAILVPMDGSPLSHRALETAFTENPDGDIVVLHVIDPMDPGYSYYPFDSTSDLDREPRHGSEEWYDRAREMAEELFEETREIAEEHDAELATELQVGDPAHVIVDVVEDLDIDHVIMGSHGRDEDTRILLGSVTESVAYRSPTRVTLVR